MGGGKPKRRRGRGFSRSAVERPWACRYCFSPTITVRFVTDRIIRKVGEDMSLPVVTGRGFLISDGVELKYSQSGVAYARLPLSFKNSRKTETGWTHDKEVLIEGTVFGHLAETLAELVTSRQELSFSGEVYVEEYEGKRYIKANVLSAWPVREGNRAPAMASGSSAPPSDLPF